MQTLEKIPVVASDVSGQRRFRGRLPKDATVKEMIHGFVSDMRLPRNDTRGEPLVYHALLEREGRHLHSTETIGKALRANDKVVLQPNIDAGGPA
jgi:hypothetical protein